MPKGSRKRALIMGVGGFLLFGSWALFANREHSTAVMIRSGIAQGTFSFFSTAFSVLLLEFLFGLGKTPTQKFLLGAICTPLTILAVMTTGHLIAGTPNVIATLAPSWIIGVIFAFVYTTNLRRIEAQQASRPSS